MEWNLKFFQFTEWNRETFSVLNGNQYFPVDGLEPGNISGFDLSWNSNLQNEFPDHSIYKMEFLPISYGKHNLI